MIIVNLSGSLGNQMFEYATARRLSLIHRTKIKLDLNIFNKQKHRFLLNFFRTEIIIASQKEINAMINSIFLNLSNVIPSRYHSVYFQILKARYKSFLTEKYFHFDNSVLSAPDNVYLTGYWQSEKYFSDIKDTLKNEFTLKGELSNGSKRVLDNINIVNSISVNIRRGDYVTNKEINSKHGVLEMSYYHSAVKYIFNKVKNPHYFIFSDDITWAKKYFKINHPTRYIDINYPDRVYEDLILISKCRHNILANSSFSWWGGWLNNNENKIVIAPKQWFKDKSLKTADLLPDKWVKI
jgi:hypothetical protein